MLAEEDGLPEETALKAWEQFPTSLWALQI